MRPVREAKSKSSVNCHRPLGANTQPPSTSTTVPKINDNNMIERDSKMENDPYLAEAKRYVMKLENCEVPEQFEPQTWLSIIALSLVSIADSQATLAANSNH